MSDPAGGPHIDPRAELRSRFDAAWESLRETLDSDDFDPVGRTAAGWSAQEMLGHLAFWLECTRPVVVGMLRGDSDAIAGWEFGSGYRADAAAPWPIDSVHNAREAEWARSQDWPAVVARLERARTTARSTINSLSADEAIEAKFVSYIEGSIAHLGEHVRELRP